MSPQELSNTYIQGGMQLDEFLHRAHATVQELTGGEHLRTHANLSLAAEIPQPLKNAPYQNTSSKGFGGKALTTCGNATPFRRRFPGRGSSRGGSWGPLLLRAAVELDRKCLIYLAVSGNHDVNGIVETLQVRRIRRGSKYRRRCAQTRSPSHEGDWRPTHWAC